MTKVDPDDFVRVSQIHVLKTLIQVHVDLLDLNQGRRPITDISVHNQMGILASVVN